MIFFGKSLLPGLVLIVFSCSVGYCQQGGVNAADAARIESAWHAFADAIRIRDTASLHRISLGRVQCEPCMSIEGFRNSNYTSIDSFLKYEFGRTRPGASYPTSSDNYWVSTMVVNNKPDNLAALNLGRKHYIIYELAFAEGVHHADRGNYRLYRFIDINGALIFFGLGIVP